MDTTALQRVVSSNRPKLIYTIPNFQNPSGISYSEQNRRDVAGILGGTSTLLVEDDPYGDLRYSGTPAPSFGSLLPDHTIMLGTFSKTVVPGFRLGWIVANREMMENLIVAEQAADLHTNQLTQFVLYQYLKDNSIDDHIDLTRRTYGRQLRAMLDSVEGSFRDSVSLTHPEGGMFLWAELPERCSSREVLELSMKEGVVFVPGDPFYFDVRETSTMRLNFTCSDEATIHQGMARLGRASESVLGKTGVG
jgi:2-aminoadipate transaminase